MSGNENSDPDVICLDSSQESIANVDLEKEEGEVNDDTIEDVTVNEQLVNINETLRPGEAPEGFILLDESIEVASGSEESRSPSKSTKDEPIFKVIFRDKDAARKHRKKIEEFLIKLVTGKATEIDFSSDTPTLSIYTKKPSKKRKNDEENGIENAKDNALFMIDNTPSDQDRLDVPTYGTRFEKVLQEKSEDAVVEDENTSNPGPKLNCFNCLGNHNLRDCPEPRNHMAINKNRKEFTARSGPKCVRYHIDEDSRFDQFKPGVLSAELRKALGLADNQLPKHIYKMRKLGYPPGWLEDAKLEHSGLNLYDSDGKRQLEDDEEQGEIFCPDDKDRYDIRKVHDFPGFNIPAPPGTIDANWASEQQQEHHSKERMLLMLSSKKAEEGYKRKKMKRSITKSDNTAHLDTEDMEVVVLEDTPVETVDVNGHFVPPPPDDSESSENPPPPPPEDPTPGESTSRTNSPSLSDLEMKKRKLLESLEDSNSQSNPGSTPTTPVNACRIGKVTSVELGTPILQSLSPFTKLPSSEKFSKDICDVINFENLPNSTGKYEKMSGLLQKVRGVLSTENQTQNQ